MSLALTGRYLLSGWNVYHPLCILDGFPRGFLGSDDPDAR